MFSARKAHKDESEEEEEELDLDDDDGGPSPVSGEEEEEMDYKPSVEKRRVDNPQQWKQPPKKRGRSTAVPENQAKD